MLFRSSPRPTRADTNLNTEMNEVASKIKQLLEQKGNDAIAVGEFRGPARLVSSSGPSISKALADSLKKIGVPVKRLAALEVNGDYRDVEDRATKRVAVEIKARIIDDKGAELVAFEPRGILDLSSIASLIGSTVAVPSEGTDQQLDRALREAIKNPKVHIDGTRIAADPASLYAIEVLINSGTDSVPRPAVKDDDGFAFVKIRRGEIYALRLINDSPHDAAVLLTVDGLSVFAFSANTNYTRWIVPSKQSLVVPGWHRTNSVSDSFQVTEYAKSAAAEKLPGSTTVGTITAVFAAAWPEDAKPPQDEAPTRRGGPGNATGKGPPVGTSFTEVARVIGRFRASVSVRYTKNDDPN